MRSVEHDRGINALRGALSLTKATVAGIESALYVMESLPSASDNTLRDASKLLGRCLAALRSAGIEGKLRSDVSKWLATYQHP